MNEVEIPVTVWYTENGRGDSVSTVLGRGVMVPLGVFETCVFWADGNSEVVNITREMITAKRHHEFHARDLLK